MTLYFVSNLLPGGSSLFYKLTWVLFSFFSNQLNESAMHGFTCLPAVPVAALSANFCLLITTH